MQKWLAGAAISASALATVAGGIFVARAVPAAPTLEVIHPISATTSDHPSPKPTIAADFDTVQPVIVRTVRLSQQEAGLDGLLPAIWSGRVWLFASANGERTGRITQVAPSTGRILSSTPSSTAPDALAAGGSGLWVANSHGGSKAAAPGAGSVWQITDAAHPGRHITYQVPNALGFAVTATGAWVYTSGPGDVAGLEFLSGGRITDRQVLPDGPAVGNGSAVTLCGGRLVDARLHTYVTSAGTNFSTELEIRDPNTGALRSSTRLRDSGGTALACSGGKTPVVTFSATRDGDVLQLTAHRGWQPLIGAPHVTGGIVGTPEGLWIVGGDDGSAGRVYRFTGAAPAISRPLPHPNAASITSDGEDVWVAQQSGYLVHLHPGG